MPYHNDTIIKAHAMIKTQEDFLEKYLPLTLLQGFEKVIQGLRVRGSCNILTLNLWPSRCVFLVL